MRCRGSVPQVRVLQHGVLVAWSNGRIRSTVVGQCEATITWLSSWWMVDNIWVHRWFIPQATTSNHNSLNHHSAPITCMTRKTTTHQLITTRIKPLRSLLVCSAPTSHPPATNHHQAWVSNRHHNPQVPTIPWWRAAQPPQPASQPTVMPLWDVKTVDN